MDNCLQSTKNLLRLLKIGYTSKYLKENLQSHPDYPSLLSIADTIDRYNIDTLAVKIDFEKLSKVPIPCLVQVNINQKPLFFVVTKVSKNKVFFIDDENKEMDLPRDQFLKFWTGICLLVETKVDSQEKDIEKKKWNSRILYFLTGTILALLISMVLLRFSNLETSFSLTKIITNSSYILLKVIGLTIGFLLLWFEVDQYNPTLQSFCNGVGKKINCNAVLGSKHALLFNGNLSLSIIVFSYFFSTLNYLVIHNFSPSTLFVLQILSISSIPIILISVYYQAFVIKQWCKFCIIIQCVLLLEISLTLFGDFYALQKLDESLILLIVLFLIPILGWKLLKPLLQKEKESILHKRGLQRIKYNPDIFKALLSKSKKIHTPTQGLGISLSKKKDKYHVIKVCNPFCGPCAKAHAILEELVKNEKISLQIIFAVYSDEDSMLEPIRHFLAIDQKGNQFSTQQALDDWYKAEQKDYEVFSSKYPINDNLSGNNIQIKEMKNWCHAENITYTPTIFINGYELPKEYAIEDMKYIL